jgi:DNA-binding IclR family transcriptional regulator
MSQSQGVPVKATKTSFEIIEKLMELEGAGTSELASELDMATSTIHDHLKTLEECGYLHVEDGTYVVGPKFLELGGYARSKMKLFRVAEPKIQQLAMDIGHHANLMIEDNGLGVFLYKAKGDDAVHLDTFEGMRVLLHTTSLGKAILAHKPRSEVEEIIDRHGFEQVTEKTITSKERLFEELADIRDRGYALDDEERVRGMRCVAAPIRPDDQTLGAVSVSGPTSEFQGDRFKEEIPELVLGTANIIEVNMTYF